MSHVTLKCVQYFIGTAAHKQNQPHQPFHYNLEDQKSHNEPHQSLHNLGDQSTDNATGQQYCAAAYMYIDPSTTSAVKCLCCISYNLRNYYL